MVDESALKTVLDLSRAFMAAAVENFNLCGYVQPVAFLFGTRKNAETGLDLPEPGFAVVEIDDSGDDKDAMVKGLGSVIRKSGAAGVGILWEAWTADVQPGDLRKVVSGKIHEMPGAREVVHYALEHRDLGGETRIWVAKIHRHAEGKPTLGKFELQPASLSVGRFANFLGQN